MKKDDLTKVCTSYKKISKLNPPCTCFVDRTDAATVLQHFLLTRESVLLPQYKQRRLPVHSSAVLCRP